MTEDEFWTHYARRSGIGIEELRRMGVQALPCACGDLNCQGWRMDMSEAISAEIARRVQQATLKWIDRSDV